MVFIQGSQCPPRVVAKESVTELLIRCSDGNREALDQLAAGFTVSCFV